MNQDLAAVKLRIFVDGETLDNEVDIDMEWRDFHRICMGANDIDLIKKSIEKWEFIVNTLREGGSIFRDGGRATCALCNVYNYRWGMLENCVSYRGRKHRFCPIKRVTGRDFCKGSPCGDDYDCAGDLGHAEKEVKFLYQVLEFVQRSDTKGEK